MAESTASSTAGIGFFGLLTVALIVLKILGYISISWWWIAAVFFAPLLILLMVILLAFVVVGISSAVKAISDF